MWWFLIKKTFLLLVLAIFIIFLVPSILASTFSSGPVVDPDNNLSTTSSFTCDFTPLGVGSLNASITWFVKNTSSWERWTGVDISNQSVSNNTPYSLAEISSDYTLKNQNWLCQVSLTNGTNLNISNSSSVVIDNSLPIITNPVMMQNATEDINFFLQASASDPDNDPITLWDSIDFNQSYYGAELFEISNDGKINFTVTNENMTGNHTMSLTVYTGAVGSVQQIIFQVIPVNDSPVFTNNNSFTKFCTEGQICSGSFPASDEESDSLYFYANESFLILNVSSGEYSFTPTTLEVGENIILINVTDTISNTTRNFNLSVQSANVQAVINFVNNTETLQNNISSFIYTLNASDANVGDELLFSYYSSCDDSVWNLTTIHNGTGDVNASIQITPLSGFRNNSFVVCRNITIQIDDYDVYGNPKSSFNTSVLLNITNENDDPEIFEIADYEENYEQINISNISVAIGFHVHYKVNFTDVDYLTYENDSLIFSLNDSSLFSVNSTTGIISSPTLNNSHEGNHSLLLIVNDSGGSDTQLMNIHVIHNDPPLIYDVDNSSCSEESFCVKYLLANDSEAEHLNLTNIILSYTDPLSNTSIYSDPETRSILSLVFDSYSNNNITTTYNLSIDADDEEVGLYSINFTYMDPFSSTSYAILEFNITQINDTPYLKNSSSDSYETNISFLDTMTEGFSFEQDIFADDGDLFYGLDNLSFSFVFISGSISNCSLVKTGSKQATFYSTPVDGDEGNYSLNITINDSMNNFSWQEVNFTVYDDSNKPEITQIRPYFDNSSNQTVLSLTSVYVEDDNSSSINLSEGENITFDIRAVDNDNSSMIVYYYFDSELVDSYNYSDSGASAYLHEFDYFSSGEHNLSVKVADKGWVWYSWIINVSSVNQNPVFINSLSNMSFAENEAVSGTTIFVDFFRQISENNIVFLDPDDDINKNDYLDENNETNSLEFSLNESASTCDDYAIFTFDDSELTIEPFQVGRCNASFVALDENNESVFSNEIIIDMASVTEDSSSESSSSSSGGGGGGSISRPNPILIDIDESDLESLNIISNSEPVFSSDKIVIPLRLENSWDGGNFNDITLTSTFDISNISSYFSSDSIELLEMGFSKNINLTILNATGKGSFEVLVNANILNPVYNDSLSIFVNTEGSLAEGSSESQLAFAKDLLSSNPECGELSGFLLDVERNNLDESSAIERIQAVVSGCKYLINENADSDKGLPKSFVSKVGEIISPLADYKILAGFLIILTSMAIAISLLTRKRFKEF